MGLLQAFGLQGDIKDEINPEAEAIASVALAAIASDGYLSAEETKTMFFFLITDEVISNCIR